MSELDNLSENGSAENVVEGTWLDDENRATLGLRSLFVLLSGALILGAEIHISSASPWRNALYFAGLNVLFPISIIWFFFGQGLRPIDWLPDQKYNAWNYGVNFEDWKSHLKWAAGIAFAVVISLFLLSQIVPIRYNTESIAEYFGLLIIGWIVGCSLAWLIYGYLLFGMAQGFGIIGTAIGFLCIPFLAIGQKFNMFDGAILTVPVVILSIFVLTIAWICWIKKSLAPALYAVLISMPFIVLIMR